MSRFSYKNESRLNVSNLSNENEDGAPVVSGISTFSSPNYFVPPSGTTAERPANPGEGQFRFNTDSGHLEYYNGFLWVNVSTVKRDIGDHNLAAAKSARGTGTRGIFCNGNTPADGTNHIDYITIPTFGNAQDFGDANTATGTAGGACSDGVKAVFAGGYGTGGGGRQNVIQFVIMSSTGLVGDFGDLKGPTGDSGKRGNVNTLSNSTRGLFAGGSTPTSPSKTNAIDLITIQSNGNSTDFGDISEGACSGGGSMSSSVRGVICLGNVSGRVSTIEYVTISTQGNGQVFGDLTQSKNGNACFSNSTRGISCGGEAPGDTDVIEFITIASTGNGQDFGDLANGAVTNNQGGGTCNSTRGVIGGGRRSSSKINEISALQIQTTGNSLDFGDLSNAARDHIAATSNGHGGL